MKTLNKKEEIHHLCRRLSQDQAVVFCLDASLRCLNAADGEVLADTAAYAAYVADEAYTDYGNPAAYANYVVYAAGCAFEAAFDPGYYAAGDEAHNESIEILKYILEGEL